MEAENDNQIENESQENNDEPTGADRSIDRVGQLNEGRRQSEIVRGQEAEEKKQKEEKEKKDAKPNAVSQATGGLLKGAWENLVESWGFTLIWIDIHVFGNLVFGDKVFCKLGMEWVPDAVKRAQFKEAEKLGKVAGTIEGSGVACLNLGCLMVVIFFIAFYAMVINVLSNPISNFAQLVGWVWNVGLSTVTKWVSGS